MKQVATRLLLILAVLSAPVAYPQETQRYVRDWLSVALREAPSPTSATVHAGLVSGTPLIVLETDTSNEFTRVRTQEGVEGWIPSRFLSDEPAARDRLAQVEIELERLTKANAALEAARDALPPGLAEAGERLRELEQRNTELVAEIAALRERPDDVGVLRAANAELEATNTALLNRIDSLTREIATLKSGERQQQFINGGAAVLAGIIATLLIASLWPRKKQTEWR